MSAKSVPFFNYPMVYKHQEKEILGAMLDVMNRGAFILQSDLVDFEKSIAEFLGVKHVLGMADGTNSMMIALRAANIGAGDEVIFASHTYVATAAAVHFAGATPVPIECGADHMMDANFIEAAITDKTKAIMPTQLNGRTCDMDTIQAIADKHGLIIIEDSAQALGAKYKGKNAGTFGLAGSFSLYPAKVLGCFGDGGLIVTNDDEMYKKMAMLRDHGRDETGEHVTWGMNSRLDNIQAAVLNVKLKTYMADITRRREIATLYHERLGGLNHVQLPPAPNSESERFDVFQNFEIEADDRDNLRAFLGENNIGCPIQWGGKPVHQLKNHGLDHHSLPITEKIFERCFMIPMHPWLSDDNVNYVCDKIIEFYRK
ncbi:MAG: DegT/DnrJ/EryC1/StrS family aminotransferase [Sphingomonadales bacterium]